MEKTYRLLYAQIDNQWQYYEPNLQPDEIEKRRLNSEGIKNEKDAENMKRLYDKNEGMFNAKQPNVTVAQFAEMMGLPLTSLQMLLKDHIERDPTVRQSIHENVSFIKLQEGFPIFYAESEVTRQNKTRLLPNATEIGILDFYESLSQVVKFVAGQHHCLKELKEAHRPDNALISVLQDIVAIEYIQAELDAVRAEMRGDQLCQARDLENIEDCSVLGNAEKMMFYIKELVAASEDPQLVQNPFVITKLDMRTIEEFDFDKAQQKYFKKKTMIKKQRV